MSFLNSANANENIDNIQETTRDLNESDFESDNEEFEPVSLIDKFKNMMIEDVDVESKNKRRNSNESQLQELNNCIPNDLLKQIESSSPVNSIRTFSEFELSNSNLPHVLLLPERRQEMLEQPKARELIYNLSPNNKKYNTTKSTFANNFNNLCNQPMFINNCPNNFQQPSQQCGMKYQPKHIQPQNFNSPNHTGHPFCINLNSPQKVNSQKVRIPILPTRSESAQVVSFQHLNFNNVLNNEIHNSNFFTPDNPGSGQNIQNMINQQNNQNLQSIPKLFTKTAINNFSESGSGTKPKTVEPFNNVFTGKKGWSCAQCKNFNFESKFI